MGRWDLIETGQTLQRAEKEKSTTCLQALYTGQHTNLQTHSYTYKILINKETQKLHKHRICQRAEMYGACCLGLPNFLKWHLNIQSQTKCKMEEGGKSRGYFTVLTKALLLCSEAWSDAGVCFNLYH